MQHHPSALRHVMSEWQLWQLERLMDKRGIEQVLAGLASICEQKASWARAVLDGAKAEGWQRHAQKLYETAKT